MADDLSYKYPYWNSPNINKNINIHASREYTNFDANGRYNVLDISLTKNYGILIIQIRAESINDPLLSTGHTTDLCCTHP